MKPTPIIRKATHSDLDDIVRLLADDRLGQQRECYSHPLPPSYTLAFDTINADPNNYLVVAEYNKKIVGTLQLTFITYLTYQGGKRAVIEGVRIDSAYRNQGIGKILVEWAITTAREAGCHVIQLTTDKQRPDALQFYTHLGFISSHEGLKLHLL